MPDLPAILDHSSFNLDLTGDVSFQDFAGRLEQIFKQYDFDDDGVVGGKTEAQKQEMAALGEADFPILGSEAIHYQDKDSESIVGKSKFAYDLWQKAGGEMGVPECSSCTGKIKPFGEISYQDWFKDWDKPSSKPDIRRA